MKVYSALIAKYKTLSLRHKSIAIISTIIIFLIVLFKGFAAFATDKKTVDNAPLMVRQGNKITIPPHSSLRSILKINVVKTSNAPHIISLPGYVEANPKFTVDVLPPLGGRLIALHVGLGSKVKRNQVLAKISSPELAQAYTDNTNALHTLELTKNAFSRAQAVNRSGGNAIKDVQIAQNAYLAAKAEARRTEARLKTLGNNRFGLLTITSPIQGRVTALNYGSGAYINDTTTALLTVTDTSKVWVTANVPEHLVGFIKKNQPVNIKLIAYPKQDIQAKVTFVNPLIDPNTRRNNTRIAISNNNEKFQPNMYAVVHVKIPQSNVILIPISSILMNDETTSVYIETAPWVFERHPVILGLEDDKNVRVLSGIKAGEHIVTNGGVFIND